MQYFMLWKRPVKWNMPMYFVIYITPRDRNVRPLKFLLNLRLSGQDPGLFHSGLFSGFRGLKIVCIH